MKSASIFNASAGSGKTYRLAYKYVRDVVEEPTLYRHILAVTFTNKATEEMKRRILMQINTLATNKKSPYLTDLQRDLKFSEAKIRHNAKRAQSYILHNYSRFTILTIDKFFQRILRAFIQELGLDLGYTLEIESSSIVEQSVDRLIEQSVTHNELREWLMEYAQERIDDGQRWDIREGIIALSGELFNDESRAALENPVSKQSLKKSIAEQERTATKRAQELKTAGEEALNIISGAGLTCDDFKGKGRSLPHIIRKIAQGDLPELTPTQSVNIDNDEAWYGSKSPAEVKSLTPILQSTLQQLIEELSGVKSAINTARLMRENYRSFALLSDLKGVTDEICSEQNTMLLNQTARIVESFVKECDAPFIYEKVGNRFSRFMIDEFQDTSRREWNNFLPLLRSAISESQPHENPILIVGDIKQSIYRWRGGDWRILHTDAMNQLGRGETEVINMVDNYRSLPQVVIFNNEIIDKVVASENREMNEVLATALQQATITQEFRNELTNTISSAYEGHRQNPKRGEGGEGFVEVVTYEEQPPLMERICAAIDRGFKPCDIMILTRTNSEATRVAEILLAFKRENCDERYHFDVMTQQALIVGYAPVSQFIMSVFRLIANSRDSLQRAIYNKFIGRDVDTPLDDTELIFLRDAGMFAPIETFELIVKRYALEAQRSNIAYIQAIHEQVIDFCNSRTSDIKLFLKWWEQSGQNKSLNVERSERAIEVLTLHKAKGLEKRVVILPFCNWNMNPLSSGMRQSYLWAKRSSSNDSERGDNNELQFPVTYKKEMSNSEFAEGFFREQLYSHIDSVNMLYVALTRAAESLHIMIPTTTLKSGERSAKGVGKVILDALPHLDTHSEKVDEPQTDSLNISYRFGTMSPPSTKDEQANSSTTYIMDRYTTGDADLRLRMPSKRYHEDGEYAPREVGILMHKAFERAITLNDVAQNVELMLHGSQINAAEHAALSRAIEQALASPIAQEWFSGDWDRVRNECEIIRGKSSTSRRPDRVMIKGDRCVVVDYKFGALRPEKYEKQMRGYISILKQMGYSRVEGYLWYIRDGEICAIE